MHPFYTTTTSILEPFNLDVTETDDERRVNNVFEYSSSGNIKVVPRKMILQLISDSWKELKEKVIVKSFKACVLSLNVGG